MLLRTPSDSSGSRQPTAAHGSASLPTLLRTPHATDVSEKGGRAARSASKASSGLAANVASEGSGGRHRALQRLGGPAGGDPQQPDAVAGPTAERRRAGEQVQPVARSRPSSAASRAQRLGALAARCAEVEAQAARGEAELARVFSFQPEDRLIAWTRATGVALRAQRASLASETKGLEAWAQARCGQWVSEESSGAEEAREGNCRSRRLSDATEVSWSSASTESALPGGAEFEAVADPLEEQQADASADAGALEALALEPELQGCLAKQRPATVAGAPQPRAAWLALEELRGGPVRVLCRLRPPAPEEGGGCATRKLDHSTLLVADSRAFCFDAVFSPGSQEEVFESCRDLLQVVVAGGCASLLAYGHGGSGKTFTLAGVHGQEGVLPRAADELFRLVHEGRALFDFEVTGSALAVLNDELVDLLALTGSVELADKLAVRYHKSGKMFVEHLSEEACSSSEHLKELLERGIKAKDSMTTLKGRSVRSHLVFTITVTRIDKETGEKVVGKLVAVDLAGPERLKHLQPTQLLGRQTFREWMLESIEVNRSLWALSDVIQAVTGKSKAVPYRNHRLTQLLQDALGSAARSVLIVTCSPARASLRQTLASLRFASRAKNPEAAVLAGTPRTSQAPSERPRSNG